MKKQILCIAAALILGLGGCGGKETFENIPLKAEENADITFKDVSVHDPSVVKYEDTYYIFGSHLAGAKSDDLMNWELIGNGVKKNNPIIPDAMNEMPEAFAWARTGTFWAPDVIQLEDGRFYMYYCNCEGSSPLSCLGMAVSDNIEGPYKDMGIILKSGMTAEASENGDAYDATIHPNAVDPCVLYDAEGKLWMVYGSYSGGIYILELDKATGLPLEKGYGKKLLGKNHLRIEGAYITYNPDSQYYYMFLSFGGLAADGGYNLRVCRSKSPDGPYEDSSGTDMIECAGPDGSFFDDDAAAKYGVKLMGNYKFLWQEGEEGEKRKGYVSPGHNSVAYDEKTGKYFMIFHTRFENMGDSHKVRVHQMYFNEEDWPVIAPYRYTGETIGAYTKKDIAGPYKLILHGRDISTEIKESVSITLYSNGKVEGAQEGTWKLEGDNKIQITLGDTLYTGVFSKVYDEFGKKYVMSFTALSKEGEAAWGSGLRALKSLEQ